MILLLLLWTLLLGYTYSDTKNRAKFTKRIALLKVELKMAMLRMII